LHIVTRPYGSGYHVCRIVPGGRPVSVGTFDSHEEAVAVRAKLDMMNDNDDVIEQDLPEDFDQLLSCI
jgi:hypothetical protein